MSTENEGIIMHFWVNVDDVPCPSCKVQGTLCVKERVIDENHTAYQIHCMNPECWGKTWIFMVALAGCKPEQWKMENADEDQDS